MVQSFKIVILIAFLLPGSLKENWDKENGSQYLQPLQEKFLMGYVPSGLEPDVIERSEQVMNRSEKSYADTITEKGIARIQEFSDSTVFSKKGNLLIPRYGATAVSDGKWIYVYGGAPHGGRNGSDFMRQGLLASIERINPKTLKSEYFSSGLYRRANHASILLGEKLISCGGRSQVGLSRPKIQSCEYLNLQTGIFRELPSLPEACRTLALTEIKGDLYAFGGVLDGPRYSKSAFRLRESEKIWERLEHMPYAFSGQAISVKDKIYVIGGYNGQAMSSVMMFDTKTLKWESKKDLPYPLSAYSAVSHGNSIFLFGDYNKMETIHRYNIETDELFLLNEKITPRRHSTAVAIQDSVFVIGGNQTSLGKALALIEVFELTILQSGGTKVSK